MSISEDEQSTSLPLSHTLQSNVYHDIAKSIPTSKEMKKISENVNEIEEQYDIKNEAEKIVNDKINEASEKSECNR